MLRRLHQGLLVASVLATPLAAQSAAPAATSPVASARSGADHDRWRLTFTIFRSPGIGVQLSRGSLAVFVAHYPTIIKRAGAQRNTEFIRAGIAAYFRAQERTSPYVSLSIAPTLTKGWTTSGLFDVGVRQRFTTRLSGQLGVAVLHAPKLQATRVNPTVGLGVRF